MKDTYYILTDEKDVKTRMIIAVIHTTEAAVQTKPDFFQALFSKLLKLGT